MKSLLIGEVSNGSLSAGTLEIISKLQENNLEFNLVGCDVLNSGGTTLDDKHVNV